MAVEVTAHGKNHPELEDRKLVGSILSYNNSTDKIEEWIGGAVTQLFQEGCSSVEIEYEYVPDPDPLAPPEPFATGLPF